MLHYLEFQNVYVVSTSTTLIKMHCHILSPLCLPPTPSLILSDFLTVVEFYLCENFLNAYIVPFISILEEFPSHMRDVPSA